MLKYLARYTHRVAISNQRLVNVADGQVTFRYKDYADDHRPKSMTLAADEFLRRLLLHVLPRGFVKIRHYGLLANRRRAANLQRCRQLLWVEVVAQTCDAPNSVAQTAAAPVCPWCGQGRLHRVRLVPRAACAGPAPAPDSS